MKAPRLEPGHAGLLVIDMQERLVQAGALPTTVEAVLFSRWATRLHPSTASYAGSWMSTSTEPLSAGLPGWFAGFFAVE